MIPIVIVEIIEQFRDLPLVFDEKRFEDAKFPVLSHLANHQPVDERIGIGCQDKRKGRIEIRILPTIIRDTALIERIKALYGFIWCSVEVDILPQSAIKPVCTDRDPLAHYRCGKGKWR